MSENSHKDVVLMIFQKNRIGEYIYACPAYARSYYSKYFKIISGINKDKTIDYKMCANSGGLLSKLQSNKEATLLLKPLSKFDVNDMFCIVCDDEIEKYLYKRMKSKIDGEPDNLKFNFNLMVFADMIGRSIESIDKKTLGSYVAKINSGFEKLPQRYDFVYNHFVTPKSNKVASAEVGIGTGSKSVIQNFKSNDFSLSNSANKKSLGENDDNKDNSQLNTDIDVNEIKTEIKKKVIGQDRTIDAVVNNIYFNQKYIDSGDRDLLRNKANIILDGSTGTGKTFILEEVADKLNLPIVVTGITNYSSVGYKGASLDDILIRLLDKSEGNLELAERGIVAFDEFDKLGTTANNDISMRRALQQELLTFISGNKYDVIYNENNYTFDTSKITFIGMGAFTKLREEKIKENEKKYNSSIGFSTNSSGDVIRKYTITKDDYVSIGLERELVGRFSCLTYTDDLGVNDLERILTESITSPMEGLRITGNIMGCKITFTPEIIHDIAQRAFDTNTGARGLIEIVQSLKDVISNDLFNGKEEIVITSEHLDKINSVHERVYQARKGY